MSNNYNEIPHIHNKPLDKRYCEGCGQPLIEKTFSQPKIPGYISLPDLRGRSNVNTVYVSEGVVSPDPINLTAAGIVPGAVLPRVRDLDIGQLPKGTIRAHIEIRDAAIIVAPVGSVATPGSIIAFLHYVDVGDTSHVIAAIAATAIAGPVSFNIPNTNLIVENIIGDRAPANLGRFSVEAVNVTLGTSASFNVYVRSNLAMQYEV